MKDFQYKDYTYQLGVYDHLDVIWISFSYNINKINELKKHTKARWEPKERKWHVPDNVHYRSLFRLEKKYFGNKFLDLISPANQKVLIRFIDQLRLMGYSENTIKIYSGEFVQLLVTIKAFPVEKLDAEQLRSYFLYCIKKKRLSENTIHSRINAVKFYFERVLKRKKIFIDVPRPKKPSALPKALSQYDVKKMFSVILNDKHLLLMKMCYGMGLRVSELSNLKITDIDSNRMQVLVHQSKGKKDRYVVLPESVLKDLRYYYKAYHPKEYLFEGQNGGQYSIRTIQAVFKQAMQKANINKRVGVHSLRHSYATHLIEQGVDIRFVQELMGHKNIKTTMGYTHLTDNTKRKIKSPLDNL